MKNLGWQYWNYDIYRTRTDLPSSEEIIHLVKNNNSLFQPFPYSYCLVFKGEQPIFFTSNIYPEMMDLIIAYIQFIASGINEFYGLEQTDIVDIINTLYQPKHKEPNREDIEGEYVFDSFYNWEYWSAYANKVQTIDLFHHEKLNEKLTNILKQYKLHDELMSRTTKEDTY